MSTKAKKVEVENVEVVEVIEVEAKNETEGLTLEGFMDSEFGRGLGYKAAGKYWKDNGAKVKNVGFRAKFYDKLREVDLSESEVLTYAKENGGSENDIKQISHFVAIADLAREVRAAKPE